MARCLTSSPALDEHYDHRMPSSADDDRSAVVVTLHEWCAEPGAARDSRSSGAVAVARVSGPADLLAAAAAGLPEGVARAEAMAARLRRSGAHLVWDEPAQALDREAWLEFCEARGRNSLEMLRADPSLICELQIGAWWSASPMYRGLRRLRLTRSPSPSVAGDVAFWAGVRAAATKREWSHLTRASYVVLCYHRVAGEGKPGQERMDIPPRMFHRQLALLRLLGWRPLSTPELIAFHSQPAATLPRRRYVVTLDDAFLDAVGEAARVARHAPQVFAVTAAVGSRGTWLDGEPLAGWSDLHDLRRRGGVVGSHARHHVRLDTLSDADIESEVRGSLDDLRAQMDIDQPLLAYPHGAHDERVRAAARAAGYVAAYSSLHGRNGAGTDRYALRRVEPKVFDSLAVFLWKVVTGSNRPPAYRQAVRRVTRR
jgi:peptidoglycan/xylan/chitin deacetylase (PgdA/CDA1 family)